MSYTWREVVLDEVILKAYENGFKDKDFDGWTDLPETARRHAVKLILQNNGLGQIIFRKSFAEALWGTTLWWVGLPGKSGEIRRGIQIPESDMRRQQMVIADDWLQYLKENT